MPSSWRCLESLGQALRVKYSYSEGSEDTQHRRGTVGGLGLQMKQWLSQAYRKPWGNRKGDVQESWWCWALL